MFQPPPSSDTPPPPPLPTFLPYTPQPSQLSPILIEIEHLLRINDRVQVDYNRIFERFIPLLTQLDLRDRRELDHFLDIINGIIRIAKIHGIQRPIVTDIRPMITAVVNIFNSIDVSVSFKLTATLFHFLGIICRYMSMEAAEMIDSEDLLLTIDNCYIYFTTPRAYTPKIIWGFARLLHHPIIGTKLKSIILRKLHQNMLNSAMACINMQSTEPQVATTAVGLVLLELVDAEFIPYKYFCNERMIAELTCRCNAPNHLSIFDALAEYYKIKKKPVPYGMSWKNGSIANMRASIREIENFEIY